MRRRFAGRRRGCGLRRRRASAPPTSTPARSTRAGHHHQCARRSGNGVGDDTNRDQQHSSPERDHAAGTSPPLAPAPPIQRLKAVAARRSPQDADRLTNPPKKTRTHRSLPLGAEELKHAVTWVDAVGLLPSGWPRPSGCLSQYGSCGRLVSPARSVNPEGIPQGLVRRGDARA